MPCHPQADNILFSKICGYVALQDKADFEYVIKDLEMDYLSVPYDY
jgi:hypothetical protein